MSTDEYRSWATPTLTEYGSVEELTKWHYGDTNKHLGADDGFTFSEGNDSIGPGTPNFS